MSECYLRLVRAEVHVTRGAMGDSVWEMATRPPCRVLRPHVLRLVGYDERGVGPARQRQFPASFVVMIVEFGPPIRVMLGGDSRLVRQHPGGFVAGMGEAFAITEHQGQQRGVQVDLTPTGARRLLRLPLCELGPQVVGLRDLLPREGASLAERLAEASDWGTRLALVEALLVDRILDANLDTRRVDWALDRIQVSEGRVRVGALATELGCSHKHLIALFRDQVGVAPKLMSRLVRFASVMRHSRGPGPVRWAELARHHGFADQAHLSRELRALTGLTAAQARDSFADLADALG